MRAQKPQGGPQRIGLHLCADAFRGWAGPAACRRACGHDRAVTTGTVARFKLGIGPARCQRDIAVRFVEQADVVRDPDGGLLVRITYQHRAAADFAPSFDRVDDIVAIGQPCRRLVGRRAETAAELLAIAAVPRDRSQRLGPADRGCNPKGFEQGRRRLDQLVKPDHHHGLGRVASPLVHRSTFACQIIRTNQRLPNSGV